MESKRILLSDRHFYELRLSEQSLAVIAHALTVLGAAFSEEPQYRAAIEITHRTVANALVDNDVKP